MGVGVAEQDLAERHAVPILSRSTGWPSLKQTQSGTLSSPLFSS